MTDKAESLRKHNLTFWQDLMRIQREHNSLSYDAVYLLSVAGRAR